MEKAVAGTSKLNVEQLVVKSLNVETMITAHVGVFATPKPTIVELSTARTALTTAINNALDGGKALNVLKRERAKELRDLLSLEVDYVNSIAKGDVSIIALSGFAPGKTPAPIGPLVAPDGLVVFFTGVEGELGLRWHARYGAKSYNVFQTKGNPSDPGAAWELVGQPTRSRFTVDGLNPGTFYSFAVTALGAAGESGKSEAAASVAA
jgi:hypothetical protein